MMEASRELRQPRPEDTGAVADLIEALGYRPPPLEDIRGLLGEIERSGGEVWVAETATGGVVGLMTLLFFPVLREGGTAGRIEELVVAEDSRGQGIGSVLLQHAEARARARGALWLELYTARSRANYVKGFYPSRGFEERDAALFRRWLSHRPPREGS